MNKLARTAIILFAILIASSFTTLVSVNGKNMSVETANSSVNQAFISVLAAEKAGANVTQLLLTLSSAGEFLAEAENAYLNGNLTTAISKAENAILLVEQVNADALRLRDAALVESQNNYWSTLTFSVIGVFVFCIVLLIVWRRFKYVHVNKLLGMKPEVIEDVS